MSDLALSFAVLVKNNNGFFKSEKQAKFLLSQCQEDNVYITGGSVHGNTYNLFYHCDEKGVTKVVKGTRTKADTITWVRKSDESFQEVQELHLKARKASERLSKIISLKNGARINDYGMADVWLPRMPGCLPTFLIIRAKRVALRAKRVALRAKLEEMFHEAMRTETEATDAWIRAKRK